MFFSISCLIVFLIEIYYISENILLLYVLSTGNINYSVNSIMRDTDIFLFYLKILLSLCRNISEVSPSLDDAILFFLNIITLIYFHIGIFYFFHTIYDKPIYSIIIKNNVKLRYFFYLFSSLMILLTLFLYDEHLFMYIILTIGIIILCIILAYEYNPITLSLKYINFLNFEEQILLLLNLMQNKDKELYLKIYNEKIKFHFLFCRKCIFCLQLKKYRENNPKDNFDFNTLHKLFLTLIQKENKKLGHHKLNYIHEVYDLLSNLKENACYNLKMHHKFQILINRYQNLDQNMQFNIRIIYEDFCSEMKIPENIKWKQVSLLDLILKEIKDIFESIEEKIQYYSIMSPS